MDKELEARLVSYLVVGLIGGIALIPFWMLYDRLTAKKLRLQYETPTGVDPADLAAFVKENPSHITYPAFLRALSIHPAWQNRLTEFEADYAQLLVKNPGKEIYLKVIRMD